MLITLITWACLFPVLLVPGIDFLSLYGTTSSARKFLRLTPGYASTCLVVLDVRVTPRGSKVTQTTPPVCRQ